MLKVCTLNIDGEPFQFNVEGEFFWGQDEVLYNHKDSVISKTDWELDGYGFADALNKTEFQKLQKSITSIILNALKSNGADVDASKFQLTNYHKYVKTQEQHLKVIEVTSKLEISDFDFDLDLLSKRFSKNLGFELTSWIEELKKSYVLIRISRPNSLDINPPHKDGYLSYWQNIVNVWLPISGCNSKSSLPVVKGSHLWPERNILRTEPRGAKINGNTYHVPCILETLDGPLQMVRPNPKEGQALLFTPYLIHGAAVNQNDDMTRVSLELRFPKVT